MLKLAESTGTPVFSSPKFSTAIPHDHAMRGGTAGGLALLKLTGGEAPDLILLLGARTGFLIGGRTGAIIPNDECKIIQVDVDGSEIGRSRHVDVGIVADVDRTVKAMNVVVGQNPFKAPEDWTKKALELKSWKAPHNEKEPIVIESNSKLHPYHGIKKVLQTIPKGSIVCIDGGECGGWTLQNLNEANASISMITTGYLGFLGNGYGYSLGAAIAEPSKLVLNIQGDGSAGFHIGELDTYAKFGVNILTVIVNNSVWGMSQGGQDLIYGEQTDKRPCTAMNPKVKYELVGEGFGCTSAVVDSRKLKDKEGQKTLDAVKEAVEKLVSASGPGLLNLEVSDVPYQDTTKAMVGKTEDPEMIVVPYYDNLPRPHYKKTAANGATNGPSNGA